MFDVVDELTDTEANLPPRLSEVTDIENVPEGCETFEVFYYSNNNFEIENASNTSFWIPQPFKLDGTDSSYS